MNKRLKIEGFSLLITILSSPTLYAEPPVIYDSGITQSTTPYMVSIKPPNQQKLLQSAQIDRKRKQGFIAVSTPELTPGKVHSRKINHPYLDTPFFIVGADRLSYHWLVQNRQQLKKLNAIGIAVNVKKEQHIINLEHSAGGINISPVRGGKIARQLGIKHYPVLVSGTLIEQ